jgi:hypothetical protein
MMVKRKYFDCEDGNFSYYHPDDLGVVLFPG